MELHRFMLEYILQNICGGKKTYCASQIGMKYEEFRKAYQRIQEGNSSPLIMKGMLDYIHRKGIDVREIFEEYDASNLGEEIERRESACDEAYTTVMSRITRCKRNVLDFFTVFKASEELCQELKAHYCKEVCPCQHHISEDCPIVRFDRFIVELKQMESVFSEEENNGPKTD